MTYDQCFIAGAFAVPLMALIYYDLKARRIYRKPIKPDKLRMEILKREKEDK